MNLLLIRHGEIPSNVNKVYAGRSPELLTDKGLQQAKEVVHELRGYKVDLMYSSPIKRAVQTAEIIENSINISVVIENAFRELELGPWEGLSEQSVAEKYAEQWLIWQSRPAELRLPGRETLSELLNRVLAGIQKIQKSSDNRTVAVITHVAIIRVLLLWHAKKSLNLYKTIHVPNAKIFELEIDKQNY